MSRNIRNVIYTTRIKNMWIKQLCNRKAWDFVTPGFPGAKTFRDLRETGLNSSIL